MCAPSWKVGLLNSAFYVGNAVTVLWIPRLSDKSGRKKFFGVGLMIDLLLFLSIFLTTNMNVMIGVLFCFGASNVMRTQIGWVYMMELSAKRS